jgi:hypothetical protein
MTATFAVSRAFGGIESYRRFATKLESAGMGDASGPVAGAVWEFDCEGGRIPNAMPDTAYFPVVSKKSRRLIALFGGFGLFIRF